MRLVTKLAPLAVVWGTVGLESGAVSQPLSPELQQLDAKLPGQLIDDPTRLDWASYGSGYKSAGVRDPSIPGGGAAVRFAIEKKGERAYSVAANIPLLADIEKGEAVTVGFYARTIASQARDGKGVIGVRFQQNAPPYHGFGDKTVAIGLDWQWYEVTATASSTIKKSQAIVSLQLAGAQQTIEIGQAIVVKGAASIASPASSANASAATVELPEPLKGAGQLIDDPSNRDWGNSGSDGNWAARDEPAIWLGKATRYTTTQVGTNAWDLGTTVPIVGAVKEGEKILIAIAARTESASTPDGKALVGMRIQATTPPYDGFADAKFKVGPKWQLIRIAITAPKSLPAGSAELALHFADAVQSVDVGPIYILKTE